MSTTSIFKRLFSYLKSHKKYLMISLLVACFQVALTLLTPLIIGQMIDNMLGVAQVNFVAISQLLILFLTISLLASIAQLIVNYYTNKLSYITVNTLRNELIKKISQLPLQTIDTKPHGEFMNIMIADIELIANGLIQGSNQFLLGMLTIIGTIALMFYTQFNMTILVLCLTPLSIIVAQFIAKRVFTRYQEQSKIRAELASFTEEMITNTALIKNFSYEKQAQKRFNAINNKLYNKGWRAHFYAASVNPSTRVVNNIIYASAGVYGAILAQNNLLTIGSLSAFLSYSNQYMKPFNEISNVMAEVQAALASSSRVFSLLDLSNEIPDSPNARPLKTIQGKVAMENIAFSYTADKPFIKDLSFTAQPAQTIAIVGPTGCGKTTLINLLMRFYELNGGHILIDEKDSLSITKKSLREQFGMVLQDSWIFTGTVRENIAYGKPNASLDEVIAVAKKAQIHHSIEQLPQGYNTLLTSKHETLSQGQKQLLCIARIMLIDPPMLILDEATSNIDTRTEIIISQTFKQIMKNRTNFIIAHRLSTIQNADIILVMQDGAIVERGNHETLLKANGFYTKLYNSQFTTQ